MSDWTVGLDLGQAADYSALVAVETVPGDDGALSQVRHLERFALGTSYPRIAQRALGLLSAPPLHRAVLVVDGTGVGRAVVDLLRSLGPRLTPVSITAGQTAALGDDGYWRVPKRDLVGAVQIGLQSGTLKVARSLPEASTLTRELLNFRLTITAAGNDQYAAWREGEHDDLVLALAVALWWRQTGCRLGRPLGVFAQGSAKVRLADGAVAGR